MTSGDPGLAMPSKMFSSEGGVLHLHRHMEMCISTAGLWQQDSDLLTDDQTWTRQLKRKVSRHCPKEIRCNSFFLRHRKYLLILPSRPPYCCGWSLPVCFNPHWDMSGERSWLPALQIHSGNAPKHLSACIDIHWGTQTYTHKALANFGASVQTGDMQGFQNLSSLKLELRPHPKSTMRFFTVVSMYWKKSWILPRAAN